MTTITSIVEATVGIKKCDEKTALSNKSKLSRIKKPNVCVKHVNNRELIEQIGSPVVKPTAIASTAATAEWSMLDALLKPDTRMPLQIGFDDDDIDLDAIAAGNFMPQQRELGQVLEISADEKLCPDCQTPCILQETSLICEKCGLEREWDEHLNNGYNASIEQNYNTSSASFMSYKVTGHGSYRYHKLLLRACANYNTYRYNTNKKEIINKIHHYEGNKPPQNVINDTADLFDAIKQKGAVFRGNGKWGVIGACLYYTCIKHNLTRTPREIAAIVGVEEKFLSQGDRILQEYNELGIINISTNHKPTQDYLDQYFPILGISPKYKQFIVDIIARAEKKHLHVTNESRTTTKIIGAIYLLCCRVPSLQHIKKERISAACGNISKTTFVRYYNLLMDNHDVLKRVFKKHRIPMPLKWRI